MYSTLKIYPSDRSSKGNMTFIVEACHVVLLVINKIVKKKHKKGCMQKLK